MQCFTIIWRTFFKENKILYLMKLLKYQMQCWERERGGVCLSNLIVLSMYLILEIYVSGFIEEFQCNWSVYLQEVESISNPYQ